MDALQTLGEVLEDVDDDRPQDEDAIEAEREELTHQFLDAIAELTIEEQEDLLAVMKDTVLQQGGEPYGAS